MRILCTRKAVWVLAAVLMVVGLVGAYAQATPPVSAAAPSSAAGKPKEVPLGSSSAGAALPSLDLQVSDSTGGSSSGSMVDVKMGMEMKSPMMGMGSGGMSVKETEEVKISPPMGPMMGMGSMAGMNSNASMTGMTGMSGAVAPDALSSQLLSTNTLLTQFLAKLSSQPGGISPAQLQTINQLLANQATLLQLLLNSGGSSGAASASMPSNGMSGMNSTNGAGGMGGMGGGMMGMSMNKMTGMGGM